jgi:thiamine transporter ThiT
MIASLIETLSKNNISALYVENRKQALQMVMSMIPEGSTVGFGDSVTLTWIPMLVF